MDQGTVNQRMRAARALRGLEQSDLDALFAEDGLGKQEASRLERGELPLTAARRHALVRHLRVPEEWFTVDDPDEIIGVLSPERSLSAQLDALDERLTAIEDALKQRVFAANTREMAIERQLHEVAQAIARLQPPPPR